MWKKVYGKEFYAWYGGLSGSLIETLDGGYALGGSIFDSVSNQSDAVLYKFDGNLDTLWKRMFGGSRFDIFYQCRQTWDKGYILFGQTESFGNVNGDYYLVKTDSLGNFQWQKTYGGSGIERGLTIEITSDNGFILSGVSANNCPGISCAWVIKTDSLGNVKWSNKYGTQGGEDHAGSVALCADGAYLLWGGIDSLINTGDDEYAEFVAKLDTNGEIIWRTFFNNPAPHNIWQLRELDDGSIVFIGEKEIPEYDRDGGWMVKLNSDGDVLWERQYSYLQYPGAERCSSFFQGDFQQTSDGGFIVTGGVFNIDSGQTSGISNQDIWLLKLDSNGCLGPDSCGYIVGIHEIHLEKHEANVFIYPNPFSSSALASIKSKKHQLSPVSLSIYDLAGRCVQTYNDALNQYGYAEFYVLRNNLPSGIYVYEIATRQERIARGKIVVN